MSELRTTKRKVHEQLLAIRAEHGELTPQVVVDAARDESHPLHNRFEWNDTIAAEAHRRSQAAELIRSVKVIYTETPDGEERKVRAWSATEAPTNCYQPTEEVMADGFGRKLLLRQAERDMLQIKRKYGHLQEFATIVTTVMEVS